MSLPHTQRSRVRSLAEYILNFFLGLGLVGKGEEEFQSLISAPKYTCVRSLIIRSAFVVKAYLMLIAVRQSDGNVKPGGLLGAGAEYKSALMPAPGFIFILPNLTFITHTLHLHIRSSSTSHIYRYTSLCNVIRLSGAEIENGSHNRRCLQ